MYQTKKTLLTGLPIEDLLIFARIRVFQMSSTYPPKPVCMILSGLSSTSVCVPVIVSLRTLPYQATVKLYCQCHNHPAHPFIFSFNYTKSLLDYCLYKKGLKKKTNERVKKKIQKKKTSKEIPSKEKTSIHLFFSPPCLSTVFLLSSYTKIHFYKKFGYKSQIQCLCLINDVYSHKSTVQKTFFIQKHSTLVLFFNVRLQCFLQCIFNVRQMSVPSPFNP
jgi:hypothetical protein